MAGKLSKVTTTAPIHGQKQNGQGVWIIAEKAGYHNALSMRGLIILNVFQLIQHR